MPNSFNLLSLCLELNKRKVEKMYFFSFKCLIFSLDFFMKKKLILFLIFLFPSTLEESNIVSITNILYME